MLEENEQQPTSKQHTPLRKPLHTPSSPTFVPVDNVIQEDDLFSDPECASLWTVCSEFTARIRIPSHGLDWAAGYFTPGWFQNKDIEDENQYKEDYFMNTDSRPERILWLGCKLAIQISADKGQLP